MDALAATEPTVGRSGKSLGGVVFGLLGGILAGLFVAALIFSLIATQLLGFHVFAVASNSMAPTLNRGDLVVTRPAAVTTVKQGDIVAFIEGETTPLTVVHRVAGLINLRINTTDSKTGATGTEESRLLLTRGDANPTNDGQPVEPDRFRGVVFITVPAIGAVLGATIFHQVLLAIAILTALAWFAYELRALRRRRRTTEG
jgi:signal peptidase I